MSASLQNIGESNHVGIDISVRVNEGEAHARLSGQMKDYIGVILLEERFCFLTISKIRFEERKAMHLLKRL